jgi:hypothetical protein
MTEFVRRGLIDWELLRWAANFLFFYYLFLHGYMQSWYLLPLLPLLPCLPKNLQLPMKTLCVSAVAYYVFYVPLQCSLTITAPVLVGVSEFSQAAVVLLPPMVTLIVQLHRQSALHH